MNDTIKLNEIEASKLTENGKLVLFRRVEFPQGVEHHGVDQFQWDGRYLWQPWGKIEGLEDARQKKDKWKPCPFGKPGDVLTTMAGFFSRVKIVSVDARRLDGLLSKDMFWVWRIEVEVTG